MGIYQNKIKRLLKYDPFSELLPVLEYWHDKEAFLLDGPALGTFFIGSPSVGGSDKIKTMLHNLYRLDFPADALLQVKLVRTPDIEQVLDGFNKKRSLRNVGDDQEYCDNLSQATHDFYKKGAVNPINDASFTFANYEFWVILRFPIKTLRPSEDEFKEFTKLTKRMQSMLSRFGCYKADEAAWYRRMQVLVNMFDESSGWRNSTEANQKLFTSDLLKDRVLGRGKKVDFEDSGLSIKDRRGREEEFVKNLSIEEMPEEFVYGQMMDLVGDWLHGTDGLYEHHMISLNIHYPSQKKALSSFKKRRLGVNNQAKGVLLQWIDKLRFQKRDFDTVNREIEQEKSKLVNYQLQITTFTPTKRRAEDFSDHIIKFMGDRGVKVVEDNYFSLPHYIASLPFGLSKEYAKESCRFEEATSKAMAFLTPHMGSWAGNSTEPQFLMTTRTGQVVGIDLFSSPTNYNFFISAVSGAGKSFLTAYLINNFITCGSKTQESLKNPSKFDDGGQVFVLDVGRSYQGLADEFEGAQFIEFGSDIKYSLNPFPTIHEISGKDNQMPMVMAMLKTMASPMGDITDHQNAEMQKLFMVLWNEKKQASTITDYADLCEASEFEDITTIGRQLRPFCEGGQYGHLFDDSKPPINYSSRLIVCELEETAADLHLQTVVLMTLIMSIQHKMYMTDDGRRRLFLLDEAWKYLKATGPSAKMLAFFAEFLETGYRRFRKYRCAGGVITQSIYDGYASEVGQAILENCSWNFMLMQKNATINALKEEKKFGESAAEFELMKSVERKKKESFSDNVYSEIYITPEDGPRQVCRLYTDRRMALTNTTDEQEKLLRDELIEKGYSRREAIEKMVEMENQRLGR